ncbi:phage tail protein [Acinetobacter radioresistens]|uniref:TipJ family phage tail tip protein n=1 Tax=Acinetobacter radioresistens TaxID=40216 RepID=UPI0020056A38|nr:phage tail protein [Acinetobacter radioresistens]MCK4095390.1 phage tail protein [Acinetobacter radioresistens]
MNAVIKGAKKGSGEARKAVIAPDSAQSKTYIKILYGLSEGEVEGLANGLQSVFLEETPLHNPNGGSNFQDIQFDFRHGTNDQTHIEGFPDISSETAINVELVSGTPWVRAISNTDLDAVRVRFKWGPLREQNAKNGDVKGITIQYAIDLQTNGGTWAEVLNTKISDKTSANYERPHRIDLPKSDSGWTVRVRRLTPNSTSEHISDKMYVDALTEVIDLKLSYPNTAMLGLQYDAETFSNVAKVAVDLKGVKLQVPSNYNPVARTYTGMWDGTFKRAYTNNPAWIYYDICTSKRYALGDRLTSAMLDKWSLYRLAQYCDQMVNDGKGGQEPRFTCNVYLQSTEDAYAILSKLAGVFRAISYWDGNSIVCDADIPQDTYFTYTRANVIDGMFEYSGTRARDRHTVAKVAWDNPANHYKTEYVYVRDEAAIAKLGVRIAEIDAWGCTSEGQAQRAGLWALKSEQLETRTVSFKVGLDGYIPQPGRVIEIADELFAGRANGGRVSKVSANLRTITLDRDDVVCRAGDRLVVNGENGKAQTRIVSSKNGRNVTVTVAFDSVAAENVWVVDAQDLKTMKFRVMSITQDDKHQFSITGLQYNPQKYDAIDFGAFIDERPISIINPTVQAPVTNVLISSENMVQQGLSVETMLITWDQAQGATKYQVEWRKDDGSWIKLPITGSNSVEVQGIYAGNYEARVTAISAFDVASLPAYSMLTTLSGKQGLPPALANLAATGILFGYRLDWNFPATGALDTAYTEIEIATTANGANAAQLGLFAYPTDTHSIQGMQPNLTRYFRGRLIDRIGNIGPWSNWVSATTSADASAVLDILSGKITATQLNQDLQTKINKIDTIVGLDGDIGNLIDNITAVQVQADQISDELALERQQRVTAIQDLDDGLAQEIQDRQSAIAQEITSRNTAIGAETAARNAAILAEAAKTSTAILSERTERLSEDSALSQRIDTVSSSFGDNVAAIQQKLTTLTSEDSALSQRIDSVLAEVDENAAAINQEATARADSDSAQALLIETVRAESKQDNLNVQALVSDERNARIDADGALAERVLGVEVVTDAAMIGSTDDLIGNENGYSGTWTIMSAVQEGDLYQAQRTDFLTVSVQKNSADIFTEQTVRVSADSALSERINSLNVEFSGNTASIREKLTSLADADQALTESIFNMSARVGDNEANIFRESQARADADSANAKALVDYRAINDSALANIRFDIESVVNDTDSNSQLLIALDSRTLTAQATADEARGTADEALVNAASATIKAQTAIDDAQALSSLVTEVKAVADQNTLDTDAAAAAAASAIEKATASATKSDANANKIEEITAELGTKASAGALSQIDAKVSEQDGKISANATKINGVYAQVNPKLIGSTDDFIGSTEGLTGVWSLQSALIEGDMAQAQRTDQVLATISGNDALYKQQIKANADAVSANVKATTTLQTTVGQNTASIQEVSESVDGVYAQQFTKFDVNGHVAGHGAMNDGTTSTFIFNYDAIQFGTPVGVDGIEPKPLMTLQNTPVTLPNGTVIPRGLYVDNGSFGYINANRIWAENLSAISADLGTIKVGSAHIEDEAVDSSKIGKLAVRTLHIQDNAVTVPVSAFAETAITVGTEYTTIQTLNVPADMGHTILTFGAVFSFSSYTSQQSLLCRVLKNGVPIFENLEVYFIDFENVASTTDNSGQHNHLITVNTTASTSDAGSHTHGFSGSTGNTSINGVSGSSHNHSYSGSTGSSGSHSHNVNVSSSASVGIDGIHSHGISVRGKSRGAGTLNISRHDSTLIAGTFQLQLKASAGGSASVSQRYIHAMTMRK